MQRRKLYISQAIFQQAALHVCYISAKPALHVCGAGAAVCSAAHSLLKYSLVLEYLKYTALGTKISNEQKY
jgi:hypothetical protein